MKKLIFLPVILLCFSNCFSQWVWQNPLPQGGDLHYVKFINSQTGWALDNTGTIIKTTNGGNNWSVQYGSTIQEIKSICFIDTLNWWVINKNLVNVLKTTNGGLSWNNITTPYYTYNSVFFSNINTGYLLNVNGSVMKTTNSGINWDSYLIENSGTNFNSMYFTSITTGYAVGNPGSIYKTTNGGINWVGQVSGATINLLTVNFKDSNTGWAFADNSFFSTTNGGDNWTYRTFSGVYLSHDFINAQTGWISFYGSYPGTTYISKTTNGGNNWTNQIYARIYSLNFINSQTGYAVGLNGIIFKTTSGGNEWTQLSHGNNIYKYFRTVFFINSQTGWTGGNIVNINSGIIYKTTNGGMNWDSLSNFSTDAYSIFFIDPNTGWVASDGIYKTNNGGTSWTNQVNQYGYCSIYFINSFTGFSVGYSGKIIKTTNGGTNWNSYSGISNHLYQVQFVNQETGWIFGDGPVLKTTNGGNNWFTLNLLLSYGKGNFINPQTGWAASYNDLSKTTDGGNNWATLYSQSNAMYTIKFVNTNIGWITGVNGMILKTSNGGINWFSQGNLKYSNISLLSSYFLDTNLGWIVGLNGTILKTTNGGNSTFITQNNYGIPDKFSLSQNYPNPFNPSTNIKFQIKQSGFVKIKVFDILGKEIETLVNEKMQPGNYEIQFNGNDLPSGVYFYRIQTDDFVEIKKMVLIK